MANTVYKVEEYELQDGSLVTLKPANIKVMRKGTEMLNGLDKVESEEEGIKLLLDITALCLKSQLPELEHTVQVRGKEKVEVNYDLMEDIFDMETVFKVIEVYLGVKLNDPKLMEAALQETIRQNQEAQSSTS